MKLKYQFLFASMILIGGLSASGASLLVEASSGCCVLSLGGGYTISQAVTDSYAHSQRAFWGSVGYRINPYVSGGLEGGRIFRHTESSKIFIDLGAGDSDQFISEEAVSANYVGPYVQ